MYDLCQFDLLIGELLDERRNFRTKFAQCSRDAVAGIDESVSFAGKLINEVADLAFVFLVGAFERSHLVVYERF